jgi:hypothetical protein
MLAIDDLVGIIAEWKLGNFNTIEALKCQDKFLKLICDNELPP